MVLRMKATGEVVGTMKLTIRGLAAFDNDGVLIARSFVPRRVGRAVQAHLLLKEGTDSLPF